MRIINTEKFGTRLKKEEVDFIIEKLKERTSMGKEFTYEMIATMAEKAGFKDLNKNSIINYCRRNEGSLKNLGINMKGRGAVKITG